MTPMTLENAAAEREEFVFKQPTFQHSKSKSNLFVVSCTILILVNLLFSAYSVYNQINSVEKPCNFTENPFNYTDFNFTKDDSLLFEKIRGMMMDTLLKNQLANTMMNHELLINQSKFMQKQESHFSKLNENLSTMNAKLSEELIANLSKMFDSKTEELTANVSKIHENNSKIENEKIGELISNVTNAEMLSISNQQEQFLKNMFESILLQNEYWLRNTTLYIDNQTEIFRQNFVSVVGNYFNTTVL